MIKPIRPINFQGQLMVAAIQTFIDSYNSGKTPKYIAICQNRQRICTQKPNMHMQITRSPNGFLFAIKAFDNKEDAETAIAGSSIQNLYFLELTEFSEHITLKQIELLAINTQTQAVA